jgi:hypothetical protein
MKRILHGHRPLVRKQSLFLPSDTDAAMPLLRCLLLCLTAAVVLLAHGKARAADLVRHRAVSGCHLPGEMRGPLRSKTIFFMPPSAREAWRSLT